MNLELADELTQVAHAWDRAMVGNDAEAIGQFMADDWLIVGSDGSISGKDAFLDLIRTGMLSHDVMESRDMTVRVYGHTAVVTGWGISGGQYHGRRFRVTERTSCVFVRQEGRWRCVLTHLSNLARKEQAVE